MKKDKVDKLYKEIVSLAKGIRLETLNIPKKIKVKIENGLIQ